MKIKAWEFVVMAVVVLSVAVLVGEAEAHSGVLKFDLLWWIRR